jgi:hypothetical protein
MFLCVDMSVRGGAQMAEIDRKVPEPVSPETMQKLAFVGSVFLCIQLTMGLLVTYLFVNSSPETIGAFAGVLLQMCLGYYLTYRVKRDDSDYAATWLLVMIAIEMFLNFMAEGNTVKFAIAAVEAALIFPYAKHKLTTKS